jgi:hypothetical protein
MPGHSIKVLDGFNRVLSQSNQMQGANAVLFNRFGTGANAGTKALDPLGKKKGKMKKTAMKDRSKMAFAKTKADPMRQRKGQQFEMQGFNRIMQGYTKGTKEDLEDWEFLVNCDHPVVQGGFEAFMERYSDPMQGKRRQKRRETRAAKKAQRQEKRQDRRQDRQERRTDRQTATSDRRAARKEKRADRQQRRTDRKDIRTAKKEERLQKKQSRRQERELDRQARRDRKQSRIDERRKRQEGRQLARSERQERRAEALSNFGAAGLDIASGLFAQDRGLEMSDFDLQSLADLTGGTGAFQDFGFADLPDRFRGPGLDDFVTSVQDMSPEDALMTRDMMEEMIDETEGPRGRASSSTGGGMGLALPLLAVGVAVAASSGKKKKR